MRQERPYQYHSDSIASHLLSEVKHCRARLVLRWGTTLESLVLFQNAPYSLSACQLVRVFCAVLLALGPLPLCLWECFSLRVSDCKVALQC